MEYHGQMALFISVLVAFTQLMPEHQVQIFGLFRVRVKVSIILKVAQFRWFKPTYRCFLWHI